MKNSGKIFSFCFLCVLVLFLTTGDAYADDVLQAVRSKALKFLQDLRPVIFILAGFGLIGFAWMAIFNKISWKWFANIAMGLFLVANMGLFVDYFSGNDGARTELGYGNYLKDPEYAAVVGMASGPKEQKVANNGDVTGKEGGGSTPNSDSDQLNDGSSADFVGHGEGSGNNFWSNNSGNSWGGSGNSWGGSGNSFGGSGNSFGNSGNGFGNSGGSGNGLGSGSNIFDKKKTALTEVDCILANGKWIPEYGTTPGHCI